ncbi:U32 family peptidase [Victivallis sp. Marseille-Q1083]|uniref:peptidase U32 family protein n=1 Tax=Victivallis sp. Marseille-Q1083 TaxID=2717288 RepID=UPI001588B30F|nr:U32 family peptidase [Victivallis sp. Marseille-Q1083]
MPNLQSNEPSPHPLPELLAPAGTLATALAAFDAGADAVYAGLPKFTARERSENFTADQFAQLVEYAHKLKRKVYATLNTLIKEKELPELVGYLGDLATIGPDAVIVQDLGVLHIIREYFPGLEIHASTQMGIHNLPGIRFAEASGVKRVILERQLPLDELKMLKASTQLELEVFVHGALCCSLSGQCLFSSWLGGYSGNRGKCKQPCRRRFFSREGNGFFFSTQDLCTLELIPELKKLGIASLKIEGRLRQADYVYNAVSAYRKVLDASGDTLDRKTLGEARNLLSETCGRKWSQGFFSQEAMATLIQHDTLGATGTLCGKVERVLPNGFGFKAARKVHIGDRLRVQPASGDEGPALTVTKLFADSEPARKVLPGQYCFICCDKEVVPGGWIFKIGASIPERSLELPPVRTKLELAVRLRRDEISVEVINAEESFIWRRELDLPPAAKHALTPETLEREFAAGNSEQYSAAVVRAEVDGDYFLPASELKKLRRACWEFIKAELSPLSLHSPGAVGMEQFRRFYQQLRPRYQLPAQLPETVAVRPHGATAGNPQALKANSILDFNKKSDEVILPEFCSEKRLPGLRKLLKEAYAAGIRRFRVTAVYGLELLKEYEDIFISTSLPLPVANSLAALELMNWNVARVQAQVELERPAVEALRDKSPLPVEVYRFGRPPLLVTRAAVPAGGEIRDARGNAFLVRADKRSGLTYVLPAAVFSVPRIPGTYDFYDLWQADWGNPNTATFNFELELF